MEKSTMWIQAVKEPRAWAAKFGYAGILFFTVKGLCWLLVPAILAWYAS
jgi:hypothetical protein